MLLLVSIFSSSFSYAQDIEDTSIIDELTQKDVKELNTDFNLKSFTSCQDMEEVMQNYIRDYWENNKNRYVYPMPMYKGIEEDGAMLDAVQTNSVSMEKSVVETNDTAAL
jgi:hypothetical protein